MARIPRIKPGQLWVWRDRPEPKTSRCFVSMPLRDMGEHGEWETVVIYDDKYGQTPYNDVNYWPDGSHWELLSDV